MLRRQVLFHGGLMLALGPTQKVVRVVGGAVGGR